LRPIARRTHAAPPGWTPTRRSRSSAPFPEAALLLSTVARPSAGEPLAFGVCALLPSTKHGARPVCVQLFYEDEAASAEIETLRQVAGRRRLGEPVSRKRFLGTLYLRCYKQGAVLAGFGLPAQLGRLAADWRETDDGGFGLILWTKPCPTGRRSREERRRRPKLRNGEIEDGDRPAIAVTPLDALRASIRFQGRSRPDREDRIPEGRGGVVEERYVFPGHFCDLGMLATSLAGKRVGSLAEASSAFELDIESLPVATSADELTPAQVEATLDELGDLACLYTTLVACHRSTPGCGRCQPDEVYSTGSYAEAIFEQLGLELPLVRWGDLPTSLHGLSMGALFGGDSGVGGRHIPFLPVAYYDITGEYPLAAHLMGAFDLLCSEEIEIVEENPGELTAFLKRLTRERLRRNPKIWRRLGRTVCQVRSEGDVLPHRFPKGSGWVLTVAPLTCERPLPYLLSDLARSFFRTGRLPTIVSAVSLRPRGRRRARLRSLALPSGRVFDPRRDDLFPALVEERLLLERRSDLSEKERERRASALKLIVNAACFGLLCQINVDLLGHGRVEADVVGPNGSRELRRVDVKETPGRWYFPPIAAGVAACGRLLLDLVGSLAEEAEREVSYWDTDGVCLRGRGDAAPRAIQELFEQLSPYDPSLRRAPDEPLLLALEPENLDPETGARRQLYLDATASKSYVLYSLTPAAAGESADVVLVKVSEHGLGHVFPPACSENWIELGKGHLLRRALDLPSSEPGFWPDPALSVIVLTRPAELRRLERFFSKGRRRTGGAGLRPFSRLAVLHPIPRYAHDEEGRRRVPVAPYNEGFAIDTAGWRDLTSGERLFPRVPGRALRERDLQVRPGQVLIESLGSTLERDRRRPEAKALDADGISCGPNTRGPLEPAPTDAIRVVLIGKETRNLERAGITEDPVHTLYCDPEDDAWHVAYLPTLRLLAPHLLGRGRVSRKRRRELAGEAGALAAAALRVLDLHADIPLDPEAICHLYLRVIEADTRTCACGCGMPVAGKALYAGPAHRVRAHRARRAQMARSGVRAI
jgi:hypothetical protein